MPLNYDKDTIPQDVVGIRRWFNVNIVAIQSGELQEMAPAPDRVISAGYKLCAYGTREAVEFFVDEYGLILQEKPIVFKNTAFNPAVAGVVEMVVAPRSSLIGKELTPSK